MVLTFFRIKGRTKKALPTNFFPLFSTNVKTSPKNLPTYTFNSFATLV